MMSRRTLGALAVAFVVPGAAAAQTAPSGQVVEVGRIVVSGAAAPLDAGGSSQARLDPGVSGDLGAWGALNRSAADFHASRSGAAGYGTLFELRGVANTPYFSPPAVTAYLEDIPLGAGFTYPTDLVPFADVSLHPGPQGVEFGRATDGGVAVISPRCGEVPGGGRLAAGFGSYSQREVEAEGGAGDGAVEVGAEAGFEARRGYVFNTQLARPVDDQEREEAFAEIRLAPRKGAAFAAEGFAGRERDGAEPLVPLGGPFFSVSRPSEGVIDIDSWGAAAKGSLSLPFGTLSSTTSLTEWRMNPYTDTLVLPPPLTSFVLEEQKAWNEEMRAAAGKGPLEASAGIWLSRSTTGATADRRIGGVVPIGSSSSEMRSESAAAFANLTAEPSAGWEFEAGARAEADRAWFSRVERAPAAGRTALGGNTFRGFLPRVEAAWSPRPGQRCEASVSWGLRPGGFATFTSNPALMPFPAERMTAYAAGWTWNSGGGEWSAALRGFHDAIRDYQIERSFTATDYFVAAAPRAHSTGAEAELRWHPAPDWTVAASMGASDARLDRYTAPFSGRDLSGARAPYVPRFTSNWEIDYDPARGWFASAGASLTGRTNYDELETPRYAQGGYATFRARAGYAAARWTAAAFGDNLANKRAYALIIPGVGSGVPTAPRTFGVELERRF